MSDISIPGVKSKYETEKLVEQLMKFERKPKEQAETRLKSIQLERTVWFDMNRRFTALRDSSRSLFSFQNPFNERLASSSDESVLSAVATRDAIEETKTFTVKRIAAADRFMSAPLSQDGKVAAGNYVFTVGDTPVRLAFGGGSYKEFVEALNRKGEGLVRAQIIQVKEDTKVLLIEALKTGSKNTLGFSEAAETFALSIGLVEKVASSRRDLSGTQPVRFERPVDAAKVTTKDGALSVGPGAEAALKLSAPLKSSGLVLEFEVELTSRDGAASAPDGPPPGPDIAPTGSIEYEGIRIDSAPSEAALPGWTPPPVPPKRDDFSPLYFIDGSGKAIPLPALSEGGGFKTVRIALSDYADSFSGLGIRNGNTERMLTVRAVRVFDPSETGGFKPKNPAARAADAEFSMDGIEMTRASNEISDIVPGLTLTLRGESERQVKLTIEPNRQAVKEAVIALVGNYNRAMAELNIVGRTDEKVLDELDYFTADEKKTYKERLGIYKSDMALTQLRGTLQRIMTDAYPTRDGNSILASFGVSTDTRKGGSFDVSRLRGYIEIDESALDAALKDHFYKLKDIFGSDTDSDLIMDSGIAVKMDLLLKAYTETGGIAATRTKTLDGQITRQKDQIAMLDKKLIQKEAELKRKYGLMEQALNQMEKASKAWDGFSNQK